MSGAAGDVPESEALSRLALLTTAEDEVLRLLGQGLAAPEIAARQRRSKSTVETHIRHIGNKTGWRGQQRLTRLAMLDAARAGTTTTGGSAQRDPEIVHQLRDEIAAHARSRVALEQVVAATVDVAGEEFLVALSRALGQALGVKLAAVLETVVGAEETLRTAAWSISGALQPPCEVAVNDSALAGLGRREDRFIADGAQAALPRDPLAKSIAATSCLGVPLRGGAGSLVGGVVLMHDGPLDFGRTPELIVRLLAGRAAAELERRHTDQLLRDSELRFRALAEDSADMISRFDSFGTRIYASPAVETILGWKPEEVMQHSGYEIIHAEDIERVGPVHHAAVANPGVPHRVRWRGRHRNGSLVWLETVVRATANAATGKIEMMTVTRDVSEDVAALRDSEARYRNLVELLPDGIVVHDGATVRFANPAAAAIFGHPSADAMVGINVKDMVTPALWPIVRKRIEQNLRDRVETPRMRQSVLRRDGTTIEAEVSASSCVFDGVVCAQALFRRCTAEGEDGLDGTLLRREDRPLESTGPDGGGP